MIAKEGKTNKIKKSQGGASAIMESALCLSTAPSGTSLW